jgi:hypothetical protein
VTVHRVEPALRSVSVAYRWPAPASSSAIAGRTCAARQRVVPAVLLVVLLRDVVLPLGVGDRRGRVAVPAELEVELGVELDAEAVVVGAAAVPSDVPLDVVVAAVDGTGVVLVVAVAEPALLAGGAVVPADSGAPPPQAVASAVGSATASAIAMTGRTRRRAVDRCMGPLPPGTGCGRTPDCPPAPDGRPLRAQWAGARRYRPALLHPRPAGGQPPEAGR